MLSVGPLHISTTFHPAKCTLDGVLLMNLGSTAPRLTLLGYTDVNTDAGFVNHIHMAAVQMFSFCTGYCSDRLHT